MKITVQKKKSSPNKRRDLTQLLKKSINTNSLCLDYLNSLT